MKIMKIKIKTIITGIKIYLFDFLNDVKYTTFYKGYYTSKESLLAHIAVDAHTIEKGLTMPGRRFNFGHEKIKKICKDIKYCTENYDSKGERFSDIVGILKEYYKWHKVSNQKVTDSETKKCLDYIEENFPDIVPTSQIYDVSYQSYFANCDEKFDVFAKSRHSCRWLNGEVDEEDLKAALKLAVETTPSTCNRQSVRIHVISSSKDILKIQHGNRGFGQLINKFLLITSKLSYWPSGVQRNAPYVDGGIFVMNLLYCLHFHKIGACTLNMYLSLSDTKYLHQNINIPDEEIPIALIGIGIPQGNFSIARSTRLNDDSIVSFNDSK